MNWLMLCVSAILMGSLSTLGNAAPHCPQYVLSTWKLDSLKSTLTLLTPLKVQPGRAQEYCRPLPSSNQDNVELEITSKGKPVFSRNLFVNDVLYFDLPSSESELVGGRVVDPIRIFSTLIPEAALKQPVLEFRLKNLSTQKVLGTGKRDANE